MEKLFGTVLGTTRLITTTNDTGFHEAAPDFFDGRLRWGDTLAKIAQQGDCGACYAFATVLALQDRYRLFTNNEIRPTLNPLQALVCHPIDITAQEQRLLRFDKEFQDSSEQKTQETACEGGTLTEIARYLYQFGAVDDECVSYAPLARSIEQDNKLPTCSAVHKKCLQLWPAYDFYVVSQSEDPERIARAMQNDICRNGPMVAGFFVYNDFLQWDGRGIYVPRPGQKKLGGHAIRIVGWGNDPKMPYWLCANSWGTQWGEQGYYRMQMANDMLATEHNHLGLIPQVPGVMRHFRLRQTQSDVRELDDIIRRSTGVNDFTLLSREATAAQNERLPLVFDKLQYPLHPSLLQCCLPSAPHKSEDISSLVLGLLIPVLLALCIFFSVKRSR